MRKTSLSILAIGPQNVFPATDGGKEGIFGALQALAKCCDVTYAFPYDVPGDASIGYRDIGVGVVPVAWSPQENFHQIFSATCHLRSYKFHKYSCREAVDVYAKALLGRKFDAILCFHSHTAVLGRDLATALNLKVPILVREHNIEYQIVRSYRRSLSLFKRIAGFLLELLTQIEEHRIWREVDGVAFLSDNDMDNALKSGVIGNFFLAREGVPIPAKRITAYPGKDSALLILFNPKSIQNILNIKKFFYDYWIYAAGDQRIATTCLRVTGVSTEELAELIDLDVSKLNQLRVKGIGYIDDLSSLFQDSIALVSPTFIGGGIRKKILEAMANQIPVIATPLDVKVSNFFSPGRNILVMHDVDSFCDSVSTLKVNPSYWVELVEDGRQAVENYASWDKFADTMIDKINYILCSRFNKKIID